MGWFKSMATKAAIKLLNLRPALEKQVTIKEPIGFLGSTLRNRLWYRGDPSELEQFFKQMALDNVSKGRFWCANPTDGLTIRKIHSGLPAMLIDRIKDIVVADIDKIEVTGEDFNKTWEAISKDNNFDDLIGEAIGEILITGDGAFKVSIDTDITPYPILEFYSGENVEYSYSRGRLQEVIFYTIYTVENKDYKLEETYGKGYIRYKLYNDKGKEVNMGIVEELKLLQDVTYEGSFIMAIPSKFFKSPKFKDRGKSILESKNDCFDALDEVVSQWIDAIRDGRVNKYIPEDLVPRDPNTGELTKPNPFDNRFIAIGSNMSENGDGNKISLEQANINYEAYVNSYSSALDMCLQGVLSPATLGIDLKKTDNAEAQREKEKTTLYTRGIIVDVLTKVIPQVVDITLKVNDLIHNGVAGQYEAIISFGEYASPSFDAVVETVGKAKSYGVMSIKKCIDEMYGDSITEEDKEEEIQRIKEDNGYIDAEEPKAVDDIEDVESDEE